MAKGWRESRILRLALGVLVALALAEVVVRILFPSFGDMAGNRFLTHDYRIHTNPRSDRYESHRPDTKTAHRVIHNEQGFRQHRRFETSKPAGTTRIGVFGDSFTENLRIEAPYSFTEPLDFLLNEAGVAAEVLNFGTDGYGTDQIWLQYRDEAPDLSLDVVVYVFCQNDLTDLLANRLYELSPEGELEYVPRPETRLSIRVLRRFALTYLALTVRSLNRSGSARFGWYDPDSVTTGREERVNRDRLPQMLILESSERRDRAVALFRTVLGEMRREARRRDQEFLVVLLPRNTMANAQAATILEELGVPVLNLLPAFLADKAIRDSFFRRDPHWNEEGNKVAAVHLFRHLAAERGVATDDAFIRRTLRRYYDAFEPDKVTDRWLDAAPTTAEDRERIRGRYLALEAES